MRYLKNLIVLLALMFGLQGCTGVHTSVGTIGKQDITNCTEENESQMNHNLEPLDHLLDNYLKVIDDGIPSDMRLILHWTPPYMEQICPLTKESLLQFTSQTVLDSTQLSSMLDQLSKIDSDILQLPEKSLNQDVHICYWIETETDGKVLEVEISGTGGTMMINGVEVQYNPVFFDLVAPYMDTWEYDPSDWTISEE